MQGGNPETRHSCTIANAFPDGWGNIPDNPLVAASVAALFKGGRGARSLTGGWSSDEGRLTYRHIGESGGGVVVSLDPDAVRASEGDADLDSQWSFVEGICPLTVDVLLAVLAQTCAPGTDNESKRPLLASITVTARAILGYKGLQRWGAEGVALRRHVDQEIVRLHGLRFDVGRIRAGDPGPGRWNADGVSVNAGRLFDIVDSTIVFSTRKGSTERSETVWLTRVGEWAQGCMESRAESRLTAVPRQVLELDHRRNRGSAVLAKKIGLNVMMLWGAMRRRESLDRRISELLADTGELPGRDLRGSRWGARMRSRLDEAVVMLQDRGVLGVVEWPTGIEPGTARRITGWVETWLTGRIVLHRRDVLENCYAEAAKHFREKREAGKTTSGPIELRRGSVIRTIRISRNVSQGRLAGELGISAAYLSQIENDKRMASRAVLGRIAGWVRANGDIGRGSERGPGAVATIESVNKWRQAADGKKQQVARSRTLQDPATGASIGKDDRT
jgi:transcriptional regulator with XRE-family HTH domain